MIKKLLKFTAIISAFALTFHSPDLVAQDLVSFFPKDVWQARAQSFLLNQSTALFMEPGPLQYESSNPQFKVSSNYSSLSAKLSLSSIISNGGGPTQVQIDTQDLKLTAENFDFTAIVTRDLGFGLAKIRINVNCASVQIESLRPISVQAAIGFSKDSMTFANFSFGLTPEALKVNFNGCNEVGGFDQLLKAELVQTIKNGFFTNAVQDILNQKARLWLIERMDEAINSTLKKYNVSNDVHANIDQDGDLWIISNQTSGNQLSQVDLDDIKKLQKPVMVLSKATIEKEVGLAINQKLSMVQISSDTVAGLRKISCSRFYQFFLWPSLMSLDKCFPLQFVNRASSVKLIDVEKLNFEIKIDSWAQNGKGTNPNRDLAFFQTQFQTEILTGRSRLLNFGAKSYQAFVDWARSSSRISTRFMKSSIETVLTETINESRKSVDLQKILGSTTVREFKANHIIVDLK